MAALGRGADPDRGLVMGGQPAFPRQKRKAGGAAAIGLLRCGSERFDPSLHRRRQDGCGRPTYPQPGLDLGAGTPQEVVPRAISGMPAGGRTKVQVPGGKKTPPGSTASDGPRPGPRGQGLFGGRVPGTRRARLLRAALVWLAAGNQRVNGRRGRRARFSSSGWRAVRR